MARCRCIRRLWHRQMRSWGVCCTSNQTAGPQQLDVVVRALLLGIYTCVTCLPFCSKRARQEAGNIHLHSV